MKQLRKAYANLDKLKYRELQPVTEDMIVYLKALANGMTPNNIHSGLCGNFIEEFGIFMFSVFPRKWQKDYEHCKGNYEYPVPHPDYVGNKAPFTKYCRKELNMWEGDYGDNRRYFCQWLAEKFERMYNEQLGLI